jgi:hypothetical protein
MADELHASRSLDILGIKPIAESINKVTSATVDAAGAFLSRICLPAAEEFGLLLRDRVRGWRSANIAAIAKRAQENLDESPAAENLHAHPRLVAGILEKGSWTDDPVVQDLWAGLLSASCTEDGTDDSNLLFVNVLADLTRLQARLIKYACESATKRVGSSGLPYCNDLRVPFATLLELTGETDLHRFDREIDRLRDLGLLTIVAGFQVDSRSNEANLTPTSLALHMYVRCNGSRVSPVEYFNLKAEETDIVASREVSS